MSEMKIGQHVLGERGLVAGTITTGETLQSFASADRPDCDLVEVRLDLVGTDHAGWLDACKAIEAAGLPVLLTIRHSSEGGKWTGEEGARLSLYEQAAGSVSAVDIEAESEICAAVCRLAAAQGIPALVSFHDFEKTPQLWDLKERIATVREIQNAIPKIATMVVEEDDIQALSELLDESIQGPVCIIGMGTLAKDTRVSFAQGGSCITYGFIDASSAPGQWSVDELLQQLG